MPKRSPRKEYRITITKKAPGKGAFGPSVMEITRQECIDLVGILDHYVIGLRSNGTAQWHCTWYVGPYTIRAEFIPPP